MPLKGLVVAGPPCIIVDLSVPDPSFQTFKIFYLHFFSFNRPEQGCIVPLIRKELVSLSKDSITDLCQWLIQTPLYIMLLRPILAITRTLHYCK